MALLPVQSMCGGGHTCVHCIHLRVHLSLRDCVCVVAQLAFLAFLAFSIVVPHPPQPPPTPTVSPVMMQFLVSRSSAGCTTPPLAAAPPVPRAFAPPTPLTTVPPAHGAATMSGLLWLHASQTADWSTTFPILPWTAVSTPSTHHLPAPHPGPPPPPTAHKATVMMISKHSLIHWHMATPTTTPSTTPTTTPTATTMATTMAITMDTVIQQRHTTI